MVDIRTIRAKDKTDALAKARIEYGSNFVILTGKDIKVGGIFGIGTKTEHELRIMLNNSIYDRKYEDKIDREDFEENEGLQSKKFLSDRREMKKHTETIDGAEMAERVVVLTKALKEAARERSENAMKQSSMQDTKHIDNFNPPPILRHASSNMLSDSASDIDDKVAKLVEDKVKDIVQEYLLQKLPNINKTKEHEKYDYNEELDLSSSQISEYINSKEYSKSKQDIFEIDEIEDKSDRRENEIKNTINDIKEYREENKLNRERKDYLSISSSKIAKSRKVKEDTDAIEESLQFLRRREFPDEILEEIKEYLLTASNARFFQSKDVIKEEIERYFTEKLELLNGIDVGTKKKIIVLVGPTGVGKTTTIPKIAAAHLKTGKKVSFVTIDNYRIAAVDQLQRYASIMKVPFTSATTPEALRAEIRKMDSSSLLFVDTMGRSPKGAEDIVAMSKYFATVGRFDIDIQLVISATVKYNDALKILTAFKPTNYKGAILTKVDETDYLASSVCAISKMKTPLSYITFGQGVPKDISTAKKYNKKIIESLYGVDDSAK